MRDQLFSGNNKVPNHFDKLNKLNDYVFVSLFRHLSAAHIKLVKRSTITLPHSVQNQRNEERLKHAHARTCVVYDECMLRVATQQIDSWTSY